MTPPVRRAAPDAYRGANRRGRDELLPPSGLVVRTALAGLLLLLAGGVAVGVLDADRAVAYGESLTLVRTVLLCGAGILCLVRWQVTGLSRPASVGVALLVVGLFGDWLPRVFAIMQGQSQPLAARLATSSAAVAAGALLLWARRAPAVDAAARPGFLLLRVCVVVPTACLLLVLLLSATATPHSTALILATSAPVAALWAAITVVEAQGRLDGRSLWLIHTLALLTVAAAADVVAVFATQPAGVFSAVFGVAAGVVAVQGASADVLISISAQSSHVHRLTLDVHDHEQKERSAEAVEQERLHEVRNLLAGLHGATATLRTYEDRLDPGVRRRLEDAVSAELRRLAHIVDPAEARLVSCDIAETVLPVVLSERLLGASVDVRLGGLCVCARPQDLATVLGALLVNARRHAPGSPVLVQATAVGDDVLIAVEDAGPGVLLGEREAVFERGHRAGATVPGSGLGLFTARRLAASMGGTLRADGRPGGGARFVLSLPTASGLGEQDPSERRPKVREVDDGPLVSALPYALPSQRDHVPGVDLGLATG